MKTLIKIYKAITTFLKAVLLLILFEFDRAEDELDKWSWDN